MKFEQTAPYPKWNPDMVLNIPSIPEWARSFGENIVSFNKGKKFCYVNEKKKKKKNIQCGDYLILVSIPSADLKEHQITDENFIALVKKNIKTDMNTLQNIVRLDMEHSKLKNAFG